MSPQFSSTSKPGEVIQPCPSKPPSYWIEIELLGEDDSPVPWEEYVAVPAQGPPIKGYLNAQGWARIDGLPADGTCQVGFPRLDIDAWQFVKALPARDADKPGNG